MNDSDAREIDDSLASIGCRYNVAAERFETVPTADADAREVDSTEVLVAMPDLSLNHLQAYEEAKQRR